MKTTIVSFDLSLLLAHASAAPASAHLEARQSNGVLFQGVGDSFTLNNVPQDNTIFSITNPLSVSFISIDIGAVCIFNGTDGSDTVVVGSGESVAVGPPQSQVSGACLAFSFPGQLCEGTDPSIECHPHLPPSA